MKTNSKFVVLAAALLATAGSALAQQFVVRADAGLAGANKGPYDKAGGVMNVYFGRTLDSAGQNEVSVSLGVVAWNESDIDRGRYSDPATTTLWIDNDKFVLPSTTSHFAFSDGNMVLDNGSVYRSGYRPQLAIVPVMANYRFTFGQPHDPVRFFVGVGAGVADLNMETKLWRRFAYDGGWWHWSERETDDKWSLTWNATAGVSIRLAHRMTLDASYAFQQFEGATFHMEGVSFKLDTMNVSMGRVGVTWRF